MLSFYTNFQLLNQNVMSEDKSIKEYSNGEVTITFETSKCIHSAKCVGGLPGVFDIKAKPWINSQGGTTDEIVSQIKKCPSGALGYYFNNE
jgi:uncharacterized Fe-S cluster protein YjdI